MKSENVVVIAPHPDDEVLGVGGTISRLSNQGCLVNILYVSGHLPPLYDETVFAETRAEAENACQLMGVNNYDFLKIPATFVQSTQTAELNFKIKTFIDKNNADTVFVPFPDRHIDHRIIFDACLVSCRPTSKHFPKMVLAYETLSETHWNASGIEPYFAPDVFIDISNFFSVKRKALECYNSQISENNSRSIEACHALSKFRGSQNGCELAEAFKLVRLVL